MSLTQLPFPMPKAAHIGRVALTVTNLDRSLEYYMRHIGLRLHSKESTTAVLGSGHNELLYLIEQPNGRLVQRATTGLYHFALLLPSRFALAQALKHLMNKGTRIDGASDHAVSEALYLTDPDGHGIEIYRDRPRTEWRYPNGQLTINTTPFDMQGVINQLNGNEPPWQGVPPETTMGHVHLHINHLTENERFYTDILGFDRIARYGSSASFISAGGYHHHIGMNTWAGVGASPPPADAMQLQWYEIILPSVDDVNQLATHLNHVNRPYQQQDDHTITLQDPSQNQIIFTTP